VNRTVLGIPPNPASYSTVAAWQNATYQWMQNTKQRIETDSNVNTTPVGPLVVGTYTAVSTVTGTDALSNFVATMITYMQQQGITSPNAQRTTT
jgi:hypothetical protein